MSKILEILGISNLKRKNFLAPQFLTIYFLSGLAIFATISRISNDDDIALKILLHFLAITLPSLVCYVCLNLILKKRLDIFDTPITNFILFLLIDPNQSLILTIFVSVLVQVIRIIIRYKGLPIFNPAASGLLLIMILEELIGFEKINSFVSWWGVSFAPRFANGYSYAMILIIIIGGFLVWKESRIRSILVSFVIFALLLFFSDSKFGEIDFILLEGTFLFALLIMSVEPKTSPTKANLQYIYGLIFAVASFVAMHHTPFAYPVAIFCSNIFNTFTRTLWFLKRFSSYI